MKTAFYALVAMCIFAGCSKSTEQISEQSNSDVYQKIKNQQDPVIQKTLYKTLDAAEKAYVWRSHIIEASNSMKLSAIQTSLVSEALEFTTEANFKVDSKLTHTDKFIIWQQKMFEGFKRDVAHVLFASMDTPKEVDDNTSSYNAPYEPPPTTACGCATKSDWCSAPGGLHFYCKSGGCVLVTKDCGTLWNYDCDGGCAQIIVYIPY